MPSPARRNPRGIPYDAESTPHYGLLCMVAQRTATRSGRDVRDLLGYAWLGLQSALARFDASAGHTFTTYAVPRITGAILDGLRAEDPVPRSVRRKQKALHDPAYDETGASAATRAAAAGISVEQLWRWEYECEAAADPVWLDTVDGDGNVRHESALPILDDGTRYGGLVTRDGALDDDERALLDAALARLSAKARRVIVGMYVDGLTGAAIALELGVTESYVSLLHKESRARLRAWLPALDPRAR